jgi:hypothetical protein
MVAMPTFWLEVALRMKFAVIGAESHRGSPATLLKLKLTGALLPNVCEPSLLFVRTTF